MYMTESNKPWYSYPLVWMLIAIPASAVVMGVIMIWLAVSTDDGLVEDDYYKQGLAINEVITRDKRAAELGLSASLRFDANSDVIVLQFGKGKLADYPEQLTLHVQHATHADSDVLVTLNHGIDDHYIGNVDKPIHQGIWYFELVNEAWKLSARHHVLQSNQFDLTSGY